MSAPTTEQLAAAIAADRQRRRERGQAEHVTSPEPYRLLDGLMAEREVPRVAT